MKNKYYILIYLLALTVVMSMFVGCGKNDNDTAKNAVQVYLDKANDYTEQGDIDSAIAVLEEGLEKTDSAQILSKLEELKAIANEQEKIDAPVSVTPPEQDNKDEPTDDTDANTPDTVEPEDSPAPVLSNVWLADCIIMSEPDTRSARMHVGSWKANSYQGNFVIGTQMYNTGVGVFANKEGSFDWKIKMPSGAQELSFDYGPDGAWQYGDSTLYGTNRISIYDANGVQLFDSDVFFGSATEIFAPISVNVPLNNTDAITIRLTTTKGSKGTANIVIGNAAVSFVGESLDFGVSSMVDGSYIGDWYPYGTDFGDIYSNLAVKLSITDISSGRVTFNLSQNKEGYFAASNLSGEIIGNTVVANFDRTNYSDSEYASASGMITLRFNADKRIVMSGNLTEGSGSRLAICLTSEIVFVPGSTIVNSSPYAVAINEITGQFVNSQNQGGWNLIDFKVGYWFEEGYYYLFQDNQVLFTIDEVSCTAATITLKGHDDLYADYTLTFNRSTHSMEIEYSYFSSFMHSYSTSVETYEKVG